jgi:restriction endonuclease S subunit
LFYPIAPLPEQCRIVARVDALCALTLKQRLSEALTIQNQMAGMVVEGVIG